MAGWIAGLFQPPGGDLAAAVQGTPDDAARHREAVAREIEEAAAARAAGAPWLLRPLAALLTG